MDVYLPHQIIEIHRIFDDYRIPHAFGGAIALAYWGTPRYTHDIDVNVFMPTEHHPIVVQALATLIDIDRLDNVHRQLREDAQTRIRWRELPVDVFLSNLDFHDSMSQRIHIVDFVGTSIPVLSAEDLIICKSVFDRPKDWGDIADILRIRGSDLDSAYIMGWLGEFFEEEDERIERMAGLWRDIVGPARPGER